MQHPRFIAILAFVAVASATGSNAVDCEVKTDFQDKTLPVGFLAPELIGAHAKIPVPYRGLEFDQQFRVVQDTSVEGLLLPNANRYIYVVGDQNTTAAPLHIQPSKPDSFSQVQLEGYSVFCLARTMNTLINYLVDCTIEIQDGGSRQGPSQKPAAIDTYTYQRAEKVALSALRDDRFDAHTVDKPRLLSQVILQVTYHPDRVAQLIGGAITGYLVAFDNLGYSLKTAPGCEVRCPSRPVS